eukprot:598724-Alexandrium_andersonii.AAC.1
MRAAAIGNAAMLEAIAINDAVEHGAIGGAVGRATTGARDRGRGSRRRHAGAMQQVAHEGLHAVAVEELR